PAPGGAAASAASSSSVRRIQFVTRGGPVKVSRRNHRGRSGAVASGSMAMTSRYSPGPRLRRRLCVPMKGCFPPGSRPTPSAASLSLSVTILGRAEKAARAERPHPVRLTHRNATPSLSETLIITGPHEPHPQHRPVLPPRRRRRRAPHAFGAPCADHRELGPVGRLSRAAHDSLLGAPERRGAFEAADPLDQ